MICTVVRTTVVRHPFWQSMSPSQIPQCQPFLDCVWVLSDKANRHGRLISIKDISSTALKGLALLYRSQTPSQKKCNFQKCCISLGEEYIFRGRVYIEYGRPLGTCNFFHVYYNKYLIKEKP